MRLVDSAGKPVSLEGVDPALATVLESAFGGITHQMTAATSATVNNAIKPLTDGIATLTEQVSKVGKAPAAETTKPAETQQGTTPSGEETVNKPLMDLIEKMDKRLDSIENSNTESREKATALNLTQTYIEKNHPNLKGKESVIARIASSKPKDEDAVKAAIDAERTHLAATFGEDSTSKLFSADVIQEGGETGSSDEREAALKTKKDALEAELK